MRNTNRLSDVNNKPKQPIRMTRQEREQERMQKLILKFDSLMITTQKLFNAFNDFDHTDLVDKINIFESVYKRFVKINQDFKASNKLSFFFLNFFKDFETKLVNPCSMLSKENLIQMIQQIYNDYNIQALDFNIEQSEEYMSDVQTTNLIDSINDSTFENIRSRIFKLKDEIGQHNTVENAKSNIDEKTDRLSYKNNTESYLDQNSSYWQDDDWRTKSDDGSQFFINSKTYKESGKELETKLAMLEKDIAAMLQSEAKLKGEISKLKIERDGFKKMLDESKYLDELRHAVSNISAAIMTNTKINDVKFNHQIILKNLVDDSLTHKVSELEKKVDLISQSKNQVKSMCQEQIVRTRSAYSLATKYVKFINMLNPHEDLELDHKIVKMKRNLNIDQTKILSDLKMTEQCSINLHQDDYHNEITMLETIFNKGPLEKQLKEKERIIHNLQNKLVEATSPKRRLAHKKSQDFGNSKKKRKLMNTRSIEVTNFNLSGKSISRVESNNIQNNTINNQQAVNHDDMSKERSQRLNLEGSYSKPKYKSSYDEYGLFQPAASQRLPQEENLVCKSSIDLSKFI